MENESNLTETVAIDKKAPSFKEKAYIPGLDDPKIIDNEDYKGKWVVLFFYPKDFTFVCPTELGNLADNYETFKQLNCEVIGVSTDTVEVHKAWHDTSEQIKKIQYPMLQDPTHKISKAYNVFIPEEGVTHRGTFLIDPDGVVKALEVHQDGIGRSVKELLRRIQAAQFVREHNGQVCPMNWEPGSDTLKAGLSLVGKI